MHKKLNDILGRGVTAADFTNRQVQRRLFLSKLAPFTTFIALDGERYEGGKLN
jgi:hypothetical protein